MKQRKSTIVLFLLLASLFGTTFGQYPYGNQEQIPDIETVMDRFFEMYDDIRKKDEQSHFFFEKRKAGYLVGVEAIDPANRESRKTHLFWDASQLEYRSKLPFNQAAEGNTVPNHYRSMTWGFNVHPYFGYPEWAQDVVNDFAGQESLPDDLLYGLGRAHAHLGDLLLHGRMGEQPGPEAQQYEKDGNPSVFTPALLEQYHVHMDAAIAAFQQLDAQNTGYEVAVGYPRIKYANQFVTAWLDLSIAGHAEEAQRYLKEELYPEMYIALAEVALGSCPENAILFTNGDNDTYPLLYVQALNGFRSDVAVVNLSLLNDPGYLRYLNIFFDGEIPGGGFEFLQKEVYGYVMPGKKKETEAADFSGLLKELEDPVKNDLGPVIVWEQSKELPILSQYRLKPAETLRLTPRREGYFLRQDLVLADLLIANNWEIPICFTSTANPASMLGLQAHSWRSGSVQYLLPAKPTYQDQAFRQCLPTMGQVVLPRDWSDQEVAFWNPMINPRRVYLRESFKVSYQIFFLAMQEQGYTEGLADLADDYLKVFHKAADNYSFLTLDVIRFWRQSGLQDQAKLLAADLTQQACLKADLATQRRLPEGEWQLLDQVLSSLPGVLFELAMNPELLRVVDAQKRFKALNE